MTGTGSTPPGSGAAPPVAATTADPAAPFDLYTKIGEIQRALNSKRVMFAIFGVVLSAIGVAAIGLMALWSYSFGSLETSVKAQTTAIETLTAEIADLKSTVEKTQKDIEALDRAIALQVAVPLAPHMWRSIWKPRFAADEYEVLVSSGIFMDLRYSNFKDQSWTFVSHERFMELDASLQEMLHSAFEEESLNFHVLETPMPIIVGGGGVAARESMTTPPGQMPMTEGGEPIIVSPPVVLPAD